MKRIVQWLRLRWWLLWNPIEVEPLGERQMLTVDEINAVLRSYGQPRIDGPALTPEEMTRINYWMERRRMEQLAAIGRR